MSEPETLEKSEADAIDDAVIEVAELLKDSKSLEMIEQHIYRMRRKKDMVETRLKEAVEAQLRGVRTGLFNLQKVMREASDICVSMKDVNDMYKKLNDQLGEQVKDIKDTRVIHKEHALLHSYLQSIYNFKEDVQQSHNFLDSDDLLPAHELLMKLEDCRDGIYKEVMDENVEVEKAEKVKEFFSGLEDLNQAFVKKIQFFLTRSLNSIRSNNTSKLVSMLRIIEREEKKDAVIARGMASNSKLSVPGRPKKWKEEAITVLQNSVASTFDSVWELNQDDASWISKFAQKTKSLTESDLRVVDQHLKHCFPPHWEILEFFCSSYVRNIRTRFEEIISQIQNNQGEASSYTIVYNWTTVLNNIIKPYRETGKYEGILTPEHMNKLVSMYTNRLELELSRQTQIILKLERDSRYELNKSPDGANLDVPHYQTTTPVLFYEMLNQNMEFAFKLESKMDLLPVLDKVDSNITYFIEGYVTDLYEFRDKYFSVPDEDKEDMKYVEWLIAAANNAIKCAALNEELLTSLAQKGGKEASGLCLSEKGSLIANKNDLFKSKMLHKTCNLLSELVFSDLKLIMPKLYTPEWTEKKCLELAKLTIMDYNQSFYQYIEEPGDKEVLNVIADQLALEYLITLFNTKSLTVSTDDFKNFLLDDYEKICIFFESGLKLGKDFNRGDYECLKIVAELVSETEDLVHIVMAGFVNDYPDITYDQCVALLALRGDMNRDTIRETVSSNGISETPDPPNNKQTTIFTKVHEVMGPLSSRFFQTVVAPRAAGFRSQTANNNTSVTSTTGTSFSKIGTNISTALSNSPVYHAFNQAWQEKDQLPSKAARALDFSNVDMPDRTNPFDADPRESKGPAPRPPPPKKTTAAPPPPGKVPPTGKAAAPPQPGKVATPPRKPSNSFTASTPVKSTNPFDDD